MKIDVMRKSMIFRAIVGITLIVLPMILVAQPRKGPDHDRMESYRVAYFTRMLELTPEEAEVFWPLFNSFEEERKALRDSLAAGGNLQLLSDSEVEAYLEKSLSIEQSILDLKASFLGRLSKVMPIRKVALLSQVERRFKEELLNRLRERGRRPQGN